MVASRRQKSMSTFPSHLLSTPRRRHQQLNLGAPSLTPPTASDQKSLSWTPTDYVERVSRSGNSLAHLIDLRLGRERGEQL